MLRGLFERRSDAESAIRRLEAIGIPHEFIGVVMRDVDRSAEADATHEAPDLATEGAAAGAVSGGGVGALVGLALAGTSLLIPGVGPVVVAGQLVATLAGAGIGAASGGLVGALVGMGIPEDEARDYPERLGEGRVLLTVHADGAKSEAAQAILQDCGARTEDSGVGNLV